MKEKRLQAPRWVYTISIIVSIFNNVGITAFLRFSILPDNRRAQPLTTSMGRYWRSYQYLVLNVCPLYWHYENLEDSDSIFTDNNTDRVNPPLHRIGWHILYTPLTIYIHLTTWTTNTSFSHHAFFPYFGMMSERLWMAPGTQHRGVRRVSGKDISCTRGF